MLKWPIGRHSKTRFFQNWILRKTHRHQPFDFYEIAELRKTWVSQKRNRAILREMTIANDCANCWFFAQNWCAKKEKFCVSFRKNCAKVLRMETLLWTQRLFRFENYVVSIEGWRSRQNSKSMPADTELEVGSLLDHRTGSIEWSLARTALPLGKGIY